MTAYPDPDRPLLRLLNRANGAPVLVMCGRPGNHDPAHAAAGRLPVRFHRYSSPRLFWREFPNGDWTGDWQRFVALVVVTNAGEPLIDVRTLMVAVAFRRVDRPVLWGEASPDGTVTWRLDFQVVAIVTECGRRMDLYRLVAGEA